MTAPAPRGTSEAEMLTRLADMYDAACNAEHSREQAMTALIDSIESALLAELVGTAEDEIKAQLAAHKSAVIKSSLSYALYPESYGESVQAERAILAHVAALKTTEGLSAAEWMMRTANAEAARDAAHAAGRTEALEEAAGVADRFKADRDAIWLAQSQRPRHERDLASEQAHRERGNEAGQIAQAIRALQSVVIESFQLTSERGGGPLPPVSSRVAEPPYPDPNRIEHW